MILKITDEEVCFSLKNAAMCLLATYIKSCKFNESAYLLAFTKIGKRTKNLLRYQLMDGVDTFAIFYC